MKRISALILLMFLLTTYGMAENSETTSSDKKLSKVIVKISKFENSEGVVFCHIYQPNKGFPTESKNAMKWDSSSVCNEKATIIFDSIPYGTYAITTHHDENLNIKMDRNWLGMPKEGFGISNNVKIVLSAPDFDECKFEVDSSETVVEIFMKYI